MLNESCMRINDNDFLREEKIENGVYRSEQVHENAQSLAGEHRSDYELVCVKREYYG